MGWRAARRRANERASRPVGTLLLFAGVFGILASSSVLMEALRFRSPAVWNTSDGLIGGAVVVGLMSMGFYFRERRVFR